PSRSPSPFSRAAGATNDVAKWAADGGSAARAGRVSTGCGIGTAPFGSPSGAATMAPDLITAAGRIPKNAGSHSVRSAILPASTDPTSWSIPCATAGQIVYLAT